ncbi:MAG: hypothetical protein ACR2M1_07415 [Gemmatimonadaceae bacterium]
MTSHLSSHLTDEQLGTLADTMRYCEEPSDSNATDQAHVDSCPECRSRFVQLTRLLDCVQAAPRSVESPLDLWPAVRASIEEKSEEKIGERSAGRVEGDMATRTSHVAYPSRQGNGFPRNSRRNWLAAAAVLLMLTSVSSVAFLLGWRSDKVSTSATSSVPSTDSLPTSVSGEVAQTASASSFDDADEHTEQELLADLEMRRSTLRPETSAEIDSNLKVIDQAIAEVEAASARDPRNAALKQLLAVSRERKVELLRQTENAS